MTNGSTQPAVVPGAPTNPKAKGVGAGRIEITWDAPTYNGGAAIASYRIEVSADGTTFTPLVPAHSEMENGAILRRHVHTGLEARVERHYRVYATNSAGTGPVSETASAHALAPGVAGRPTGLAATPGVPETPDRTTLIRLAWTAPADTGDSDIEAYLIEVSADGGTVFTTLVARHAAMSGGAIETAYSHTGLASETTRHYRVSAINGQGTGLPSNADGATTADVIPPVLDFAIVDNNGARIERSVSSFPKSVATSSVQGPSGSMGASRMSSAAAMSACAGTTRFSPTSCSA